MQKNYPHQRTPAPSRLSTSADPPPYPQNVDKKTCLFFNPSLSGFVSIFFVFCSFLMLLSWGRAEQYSLNIYYENYYQINCFWGYVYKPIGCDVAGFKQAPLSLVTTKNPIFHIQIHLDIKAKRLEG